MSQSAMCMTFLCQGLAGRPGGLYETHNFREIIGFRMRGGEEDCPCNPYNAAEFDLSAQLCGGRGVHYASYSAWYLQLLRRLSL